jgi:hypothetical protein
MQTGNSLEMKEQVDALKRLQAETTVNNTGQAAAELDALPSAILNRAFIRLHVISAVVTLWRGKSARQSVFSRQGGIRRDNPSLFHYDATRGES